jgi:hypothetical protein
MKNVKFPILALGLLLVSSAWQPSHAVVMTFDALGSAGTDFNFNGPAVSEDGFTLTNLGNSGSDAFYTPQNDNVQRPFGQPVVGNNLGGATTRLVAASGNPFDFTSIDISDNDLESGQVSVTFVGTFLDSSTITQTVTTDGIFGLETFALTGFTSVVKVEWAQNAPYHEFDNIVLNERAASAPEPATLAIVGLGLAGMGVLRRRRAG